MTSSEITEVAGADGFQLLIPKLMLGKLLGRGGADIKRLRDATMASIFIGSECELGTERRKVSVIGMPEQVEQAMAMIRQQLEMPQQEHPHAQPYLMPPPCMASLPLPALPLPPTHMVPPPPLLFASPASSSLEHSLLRQQGLSTASALARMQAEVCPSPVQDLLRQSRANTPH